MGPPSTLKEKKRAAVMEPLGWFYSSSAVQCLMTKLSPVFLVLKQRRVFKTILKPFSPFFCRNKQTNKVQTKNNAVAMGTVKHPSSTRPSVRLQNNNMITEQFVLQSDVSDQKHWSPVSILALLILCPWFFIILGRQPVLLQREQFNNNQGCTETLGRYWSL